MKNNTRLAILKYLKSGKPLTSRIAFEQFGTFSLQQHINVLRDRGNDIRTITHTNKNTGTRYAEYNMVKCTMMNAIPSLSNIVQRKVKKINNKAGAK